jgi:AraC-like DNA-binding protein
MKDYKAEIGLVLRELRLSNGQLSETEAAKMINRSPRRFRGIFTQVVGEPYRIVRVRVKMEVGRKHLLETNAPILVVAISLGYSQRDKFECAFKRAFGVTPAEFRASRKIFVNDRSGD